MEASSTFSWDFYDSVMWLLSMNAQAAAPCVFNELGVRYRSERLSSVACLIPMTLRGRNSPFFYKKPTEDLFLLHPRPQHAPSAPVSQGLVSSLPHDTIGPVPPWGVAVTRFPGMRFACVVLLIDPVCELSFGDFF